MLAGTKNGERVYRLPTKTICILFIVIFPLSSLDGYTKSTSIGISESMGIFGMISRENKFSNDSDFFMTRGVFLIPFMGGWGVGWKHYFSSSKVKPYAALSMFATYSIGWCQTDNCDAPVKLGAMLSASVGYDFLVIKSEKFNLHMQLGVLSQLDLVEMKVFESSSDKPEIWPVVNLKFYK